MVPFSAFASRPLDLRLAAPRALQRRLGGRDPGAAAPGVSSAMAMDADRRLSWRSCRRAIGIEWTGLSAQERLSGSQATLLYAHLDPGGVPVPRRPLRELVDPASPSCCRCRSASFGALLATATLFGQSNDVYFQVGLLTTIGPGGQERHPDRRVRQASCSEKAGKERGRGDAGGASRQRLRPILMTSLRLRPRRAAARPSPPGAGSGGQNSIGTGVIGGMVAPRPCSASSSSAALRDPRAASGWRKAAPGARHRDPEEPPTTWPRATEMQWCVTS